MKASRIKKSGSFKNSEELQQQRTQHLNDGIASIAVEYASPTDHPRSPATIPVVSESRCCDGMYAAAAAAAAETQPSSCQLDRKQVGAQFVGDRAVVRLMFDRWSQLSNATTVCGEVRIQPIQLVPHVSPRRRLPVARRPGARCPFVRPAVYHDPRQRRCLRTRTSTQFSREFRSGDFFDHEVTPKRSYELL